MGLATKLLHRLPELAAMRVKFGDKVKSDKGVEGEVVGYTPDRCSAFVRLPGDAEPGAILCLPIVSLTPIDDYSRKPDPPSA